MFTHVHIKRSFLAAVAMTAAALPAAAQARTSVFSPVDAHAGRSARVATVVQTPEANAPSNFQWDDAGIGAAGAIVLLGAGAGAATTIRRRRTRRVATA